MERANPGDLVVLCVDQTARVWDEPQEIAAAPPGVRPEPPSSDLQLSLGDPVLAGSFG